MLVSPLTLQGREGKTLLKDAKNALLDAGVPSRLKPDRYVPWYYGEASYANQEEIPWNVEAKRALTPAEGVAWLASERDRLAQQQGELRSQLEAMEGRGARGGGPGVRVEGAPSTASTESSIASTTASDSSPSGSALDACHKIQAQQAQ